MSNATWGAQEMYGTEREERRGGGGHPVTSEAATIHILTRTKQLFNSF
jgi:hypothetical protein